MQNVVISFEGLQPLLRKLEQAGKLDGVKAAIRAGAENVKGSVNQYPPSSSANSPKSRGRWYERGYGIRWYDREGTLQGRRTSETLGRRWTTRSVDGGMGAIVGNNASYGAYVQDEERQARFHGARGWKTIQKVAQEEGPQVVGYVKRAVDRALGELA
jgi:hypothetical protein